MKENKYRFIAENILMLRRRAGLTQKALSERVGLGQGALSQIESGDNIPSARTVYELACVLNVSTDAILSRVADGSAVSHGDRPFFLENDQAPLTDGTVRTADAVVGAILALEDICGVPKHAEIPLRLPFGATPEGMEDLAGRVRELMHVHHGVIFDYFELFETMGFRVIILPLLPRIMSFCYYDPLNANAFIFINTRHSPEKQLFRLAYELGGVFCYTAGIPAGKTGENALDAVHAARRFAAVFLMPEEAVRKTVRQLGIQDGRWSWGMLLRIKHRFGVSAEAFLYRLEELGLINEPSNRNLRTVLKEHYEQTDFAEPDRSRRLLSPNGRIWDLVETAREMPGHQKEVLAIEDLLKEKHIETH
jgi:Zn-dependent peptidase ImmA (M78 family)/transcriptional regulator with XRE-family HTH domain